MKTRKTRLISLLAVATLLVACLCSTVSVGAESWASTGAPMQTATITFVDLLPNGQRGGDTTQTIQMYNDWHGGAANSGGKGDFNSTSTSAYWMMTDRFSGFSNLEILKSYVQPTSEQNYLVVDWDREDRRFEIVASYTMGDRRFLNTPVYGFTLMNWRTMGNDAASDKAFFQAVKEGLANGEEYVVEVNLDDMVEVFTRRANNSGYVYTCYEELLFGVTSAKLAEIKAGTASLPELTDIEIKSADAYATATGYNGATVVGEGPISFNPMTYNGTLLSDQIGLFDSTMDISKIPESSQAHYIPLIPVDGKENTYKVGTYTAPAYLVGGASRPESIPEGQYLLVLTHFMPHKILYRQPSTANSANQNAANFLYKSINFYFAKDKEFTINITPTVNTLDEGAVRFGAPTGLRFKTQISSWNILENAGYELEAGTLIMPKDLLGSSEMTVEALGADKAGSLYLDVKQTQWAVAPGNTTVGEMWAALVNIKTGNYGREFAARGYLKATKDGVTTWYYADAPVYWSVRQVADLALDDPECDEKYGASMIAILQGFATPAQS